MLQKRGVCRQHRRITSMDQDIITFSRTKTMDKLVLREFVEIGKGDVSRFLTEEERRDQTEGRKFFLAGKIQCAEELNGNGRSYPRSILQREVEKYQILCKEHGAVGELDHPEDSVVNLKNASHKMLDVWWEGNDVYGKMVVLSTPSGKILENLIKDRVRLGISSRGLGSIREEYGKIIVEDDFQLICFDIVQEPSTNNAFMLAEQKKNMKVSKNSRILGIMNKILQK